MTTIIVAMTMNNIRARNKKKKRGRREPLKISFKYWVVLEEAFQCRSLILLALSV